MSSSFNGQAAEADYAALLDPNGTGMMGIVTIPAIGVELPVYCGASMKNLAKGAALLSQTSFPIGGENTNAVLGAHRGWGGEDYLATSKKFKFGTKSS